MRIFKITAAEGWIFFVCNWYLRLTAAAGLGIFS
jgi:hypothetical protein